MRREEIYKWSLKRLGYPTIKFDLCDDLLDTHFDMAEEDLEINLDKNGINYVDIPENIREFLIISLFKAGLKRAIARMHLAYKDENANKDRVIDYEKLLKDGGDERKVIFALISNLDIYNKNEQW